MLGCSKSVSCSARQTLCFMPYLYYLPTTADHSSGNVKVQCNDALDIVVLYIQLVHHFVHTQLHKAYLPIFQPNCDDLLLALEAGTSNTFRYRSYRLNGLSASVDAN